MRILIVTAALLGLVLGGAQAAQQSLTGGLSFQCTSGQAEIPAQCTCRGIADCAEMGRKGVCGDNPIECSGNSCTCDWALRAAPDGGAVDPVPAQRLRRAQ